MDCRIVLAEESSRSALYICKETPAGDVGGNENELCRPRGELVPALPPPIEPRLGDRFWLPAAGLMGGKPLLASASSVEKHDSTLAEREEEEEEEEREELSPMPCREEEEEEEEEEATTDEPTNAENDADEESNDSPFSALVGGFLPDAPGSFQ